MGRTLHSSSPLFFVCLPLQNGWICLCHWVGRVKRFVCLFVVVAETRTSKKFDAGVEHLSSLGKPTLFLSRQATIVSRRPMFVHWHYVKCVNSCEYSVISVITSPFYYEKVKIIICEWVSEYLYGAKNRTSRCADSLLIADNSSKCIQHQHSFSILFVISEDPNTIETRFAAYSFIWIVSRKSPVWRGTREGWKLIMREERFF